MNLDIIVKPGKEGTFVVASPNFPNSESEGSSIEEALESLIDKISFTIASNIKASLRENIKEVAEKLSANGPVNVPLMMTKLPISLN
jgi:predicted RNase H-like HicB family nuclease